MKQDGKREWKDKVRNKKLQTFKSLNKVERLVALFNTYLEFKSCAQLMCKC